MAEPLTAGQRRAIGVLKAKAAFKAGLSASKFISEMRDIGLGYRRQEMLADYRSVSNLEKKAGAMRFVRKDYYPAKAALAEVEWKLSREYMFKVKVSERLRPGEPITDRFVNIMADKPLTPGGVEAQVRYRWAGEEKCGEAELISAVVWTTIQRITE